MLSSTSRTIIAVCTVFLAATNNVCDAFGMSGQKQQQQQPTSRHDFLVSAAAVAFGTAVAAPSVAFAAEDFVKGSKDDPAVQAKLSVCMYECTKPKGAEQKSRGECIKECKSQCITAKSSAPK